MPTPTRCTPCMCTACTLTTTEYPPAHEHRVHCICTPGAGCTLYAHRLWSRCTRGCSSTFDVSSSGRRLYSAYRLTSSHPSCDCLVHSPCITDRSLLDLLSWFPPVSPPSRRVGSHAWPFQKRRSRRVSQPFLTRDASPSTDRDPDLPRTGQPSYRRGPLPANRRRAT